MTIGPGDRPRSTGVTPTGLFVDDFRKLKASMPEPPPLKLIYASHSVPWGKTYRMWHTDGRYALYVNRGELHDAARGRMCSGSPAGALDIPLGLGIYDVRVLPSR